MKLELSFIRQLREIYRQPHNFMRKQLVWIMGARGGRASLACLEAIRAELEVEIPVRQYRPEEECEHLFKDPEEREAMRLPWPFLDRKSKLTFRQTVDEAIFDIKVRLVILEYSCRNN